MNKMSGYKWNKKEIYKLIKLVEERSCLWDITHEYYARHEERKAAFEGLESELKISAKEIRKKLHSLRAQYSREIAKTKKTEEKYTSKWEYLDLMAFMYRQSKIKLKTDNTEIEAYYSESDEDCCNIKIEDPLCSEDINSQQIHISEPSSVRPLSQQTSVKPRLERLLSSEPVHLGITREGNINETSVVAVQEQDTLKRFLSILSKTKPKDDYSKFGDFVGNELRLLGEFSDIQLKLRYEIQQLIANANVDSYTRRFPSSSSTIEPSSSFTSGH